MMKSSGEQIQHLHQVLLRAFYTHASLTKFVRDTFNEHLEHIAVGNSLSEIVFKLITWAEKEGRLEELVEGAAHAPAINRIFQSTVPPHNPDLFFRSDGVLEHLHTAFQSSDPDQWKQVLYGLGGIGKTATAAAYGHTYRDAFEHIFWTNADTYTAIESGLGTLAQLLGLAGPEDSITSEVIGKVQTWLATHDNYLLILDNVENHEDVERAFRSGARGRLLFTTRIQDFKPLGRAAPYELPLLPAQDAVDFLFAYSRRNADDSTEREEARKLTEAVGHLPLALVMAAAFLQWHPETIQAYREDFQQRKLAKLQAGASEHQATVATVWDKNFAQLKFSKILLDRIAFLAPDDIPESVARAIYHTNPNAVPPILDELQKYSLIWRNREVHTFAVHWLVQEVVKARMTESNRRAYATGTAEALEKVFPNPKTREWLQCEPFLSHALVCADNAKQYEIKSKGAGQLLYRICVYLHDRERYASAGVVLQTLQEKEASLGISHHDLQQLAHQTLSEETEEMARYLNNQAVDMRGQGRYAEAELLCQRALEIHRKIFGSQHPSIATSLNNLAQLYKAQGLYEQAEPLMKEALEIFPASIGREPPAHARRRAKLYDISSGMERARGRTGGERRHGGRKRRCFVGDG
jgi:tetratricopeptide (TPR) repeat protein